MRYGPAEIVWDALALFCDWTAGRRLTNWPDGWAHQLCQGWTTVCNRHRLWRS